MHFTVTQEGLKLHYGSPQIRSKVSTTAVALPHGMSDETVHLIAGAMIFLVTGLSYPSTKSFAETLALICNYLIQHGNHWPTSAEWPMTIFNLYCYQLNIKTRTPDSNRMIWRRIRRVLQVLMDRSVIIKCNLPSADLPRNCRKELAETLTLGEFYEPVSPFASIELLPKQYLVDLSYLQNSEEFFDEIERELKAVSDCTLKICLTYWETLKVGHAVGRELINSVARGDLLAALEDPRNSEWPRQGLPHPADPDTPQGTAYFLAAVEYYLFEVGSLAAISIDALAEIPFFQRICASDRKRKELVERLKFELKSPYVGASDLIARGVGLLSTRDCAAVTALLMHEQPRFTSGSLETAEAYDKNGKLRIHLTDAGGEHVYFTIAKHRARSHKGGVMTALASRVLVDLHEMTKSLRARLQNDQPDVARQLFLVVSRFGMGHVGRVGEYFNGKDNSIFQVFRPEIESAGMNCDTFTLSRIRNTRGILVWLKTGALVSMAEAMGNNVKTVLNNYIPDWLYHRMLAVSARRLQQKIVVLATAGENWQVHVSDFSTMSDLKSFVVSVLRSDRRGNKLSDHFYKVFSDSASPEVGESYNAENVSFHVCLSPESLAALEVYVKLSSRASFILDGEGKVGLDQQQLAKLYQVVYAAVHVHEGDDIEGMISDLIAGGSHAQLKSVWRKSRPLVEQFMKLAENISDK